MSCVTGSGREDPLSSHVSGTSGGCSGGDHLDHGFIPGVLRQGGSGKPLLGRYDGEVNMRSPQKYRVIADPRSSGDFYTHWQKIEQYLASDRGCISPPPIATWEGGQEGSTPFPSGCFKAASRSNVLKMRELIGVDILKRD